MTIAMYLQDVHIPISGAVIAALITVGFGVVANYAATLRANEKSQGVLETKIAEGFKRQDDQIDGVRDDIENLRQVDRDQWKKIDGVEREVGQIGQRTARLEGRANGRSASAGG